MGVHDDSQDLKDEILDISRSIAHATAELTKLAEKVAGEDMVDPEDPMVIAEKELFNAAESIELAAKRLAALRPRQEVEDNSRVIRDNYYNPTSNTTFTEDQHGGSDFR